MPNAGTLNPLRNVYSACVTLVTNKSDFVACFKQPGESVASGIVNVDPLYNQPAEFYWQPQPDLEFAALADYPRIRLWWSGMEPMTERDSCSSQAKMTLKIQVNTGAQCQGLLMDICWAILRTMANWRTYVKATCTTWGSGNYPLQVVDVNADAVKIYEDMAEDESPQGERADWQKHRNVDQWTSVFQTTVWLAWSTADAQAH